MKSVIFLDYGVSQSETPQRIVERLEPILEDKEVQLLRNPSEIPEGKYLVVRWGTSKNPEFDRGAEGVLNNAERINYNLHKNEAHAKMLEDGVSCPIFWSTLQEAKEQSREMNCDFLRRRKHHIQGRDILKVECGRSIPRDRRSGYYVQLINKTAEYRLHMFNGECIGLAQKIPLENANPLIWNYENGWDIVYIPSEERASSVPYYEEMLKEANKALESLGLNFGAVDLIMEEEKPYILEVNTAPKLHNTKRYSKNMVKWIGEKLGLRFRDIGPREDEDES